ncbi:D-alanine--D-alanine ligase family protein [Loigolactobacillus zhaoyuanensis]|uniref:D-alanine--D-alanine ligase n=1 Tax=Loigolactobacillus zhaoyuanensis TaxID=2486017 RepID=A0ABW8UF66_9LACO|nr:D-alanine--D-alanine ligase family protein [Loigolactobacillus zhaoyuanensis]
MQIYLLYGGQNAEHDSSIASAFAVIRAIYFKYYSVCPIYITKTGEWLRGATLHEPLTDVGELRLVAGATAQFGGTVSQSTGIDIRPGELVVKDAVVFPMMHGQNAEDGTIQGLLQSLGVPYVGDGVLASAVGMDKIVSKMLFQQAGIPQAPYVPLLKAQWQTETEKILARCEGSLLYPMYVKPANLGSSLGVSRVADRTALIAAIEEAFNFASRVLVEQGIVAREIELGLLGDAELRFSIPGEVVKSSDGVRQLREQLEIPASIDPEILAKMKQYAQRAYAIMDGSGLARCDFFLTANGDVLLNEINTMPMFDQDAMYPQLWQKMGLSSGDLIEELIQLASHRFKRQQAQQNF